MKTLLPGLLLVAAIAAIALLLGHAMPLVGGAVCGIVLGIVVRNTRPPSTAFAPGIRFASRTGAAGIDHRAGLWP